MMKQTIIYLWLFVAIALPVSYCMPEGYGADSLGHFQPNAAKTYETSTVQSDNYNKDGQGTNYELEGSNGNVYGQQGAAINAFNSYNANINGKKDASSHQVASNPIELNRYKQSDNYENEGKTQAAANSGVGYESASNYQGNANNNQAEKYGESDTYNSDRKNADNSGNNGYAGEVNLGGQQYANKPFSSAADALKESYNNFDGYNYNFGYKIEDNVYNNYQSRHESGNMDPKGQVTGSYTVMDPDGNVRNVDYVADRVTGFRATIRDRNGVTQHGYSSGSDSDQSYNSGAGASGDYANAHQARPGTEGYGVAKQNAESNYAGSTGGNKFSVSNGAGISNEYPTKNAPVYGAVSGIDGAQKSSDYPIATPNYAEQNAANNKDANEGYDNASNGFSGYSGEAKTEAAQGHRQQTQYGIGIQQVDSGKNRAVYDGPHIAGVENPENYNGKQSEGSFGYDAPQFSHVNNDKAPYEVKTNVNAQIGQVYNGQQQINKEVGASRDYATSGYRGLQSTTESFHAPNTQKVSYGNGAQNDYAAVKNQKDIYNGPEIKEEEYDKIAGNKAQNGPVNYFNSQTNENLAGVYQVTLRPTNLNSSEGKTLYGGASNGGPYQQLQNAKPSEGLLKTAPSSNGAAVHGNQFEEDETYTSSPGNLYK